MADESWDLEAVYDAEIFPLMARILDICKQHRMPMVADFAYAHDAESDDTAHCTSRLGFPCRSPRAHSEAEHAVRRGGATAFAITITSAPRPAPSDEGDAT
jgi:hypothetical protein